MHIMTPCARAINAFSRIREEGMSAYELAITSICLMGKKYLLFALLILINLKVNGIVSICFFQLILTERQEKVTERLFWVQVLNIQIEAIH